MNQEDIDVDKAILSLIGKLKENPLKMLMIGLKILIRIL